jgi:hypothetical protein
MPEWPFLLAKLLDEVGNEPQRAQLVARGHDWLMGVKIDPSGRRCTVESCVLQGVEQGNLS